LKPAKNSPRIRRKLLRWYDRNKRELPWRRSSDPYAIWISETMLQQTQVKTVLPYYEKFLRAFPTVSALDRAPMEKVLRLWSGLGYYRRAENLKKAARQLTRDHGGKLPQEYAALRELAGIGEYTAGAILSIAFQQRYPAVDGNARRVLARLIAVKERNLQSSATELMPRSRPGDFNQALMELGATVCSPKKPRCERCPLASECVAHAQSSQNIKRLARNQIKFINITWPLAVVRQGGKILLRRRADNGLMARLWELPGGETAARRSAIARLRNELKQLGVNPKQLQSIGEIRHSITHRRIRAPIYLFECPAASKLRLAEQQWRWFRAPTIPRQAISSMTAKVLQFLNSYEKSLL
jgi:A/G-specific adenine glycosylase